MFVWMCICLDVCLCFLWTFAADNEIVSRFYDVKGERERERFETVVDEQKQPSNKKNRKKKKNLYT